MVVAPRPCMECGEAIPSERLAVLPNTRLCVQCSAALGGEERRIGIPENLSKAGSLKKNYGGVTVLTIQRRMPRKP
jgi:hypothetical protein